MLSKIPSQTLYPHSHPFPCSILLKYVGYLQILGGQARRNSQILKYLVGILLKLVCKEV